MSQISPPQPRFERSAWQSLDGSWSYACDTVEVNDVAGTGDIVVPFPPEATVSGVGDSGYHPVVRYRRTLTVPESWHAFQLLLHFGAIDFRATVWVDDRPVAQHQSWPSLAPEHPQ